MLTAEQLRLRREGPLVVSPYLSGPNPTSVYTPNLMLEEPKRGDYVNSWDTPLDASLTTIDAAFGSEYGFATPVGGGTVTLTIAQAANYSILIGQGETLTGDVSVIFPAIGGRRQLRLSLAGMGGHNIFIKGSSDNQGIVINAQNYYGGPPVGIIVYPWRVYWEGYASAPVGTIANAANCPGNFFPLGWLPCDGQVYSVPGGPSAPTGPYALLWSYLSGAGSTLTVPDLRGIATVGADTFGTSPGSAGRLGAWAGYAAGANVGENAHTLAAAEMPVHNHSASDSGHQHYINLAQSPHTHGDPGHTHGASASETAHSHTLSSQVLTPSGGGNATAGAGWGFTTVTTNTVQPTVSVSIAAAYTGLQAINANVSVAAQNGTGGSYTNLGYSSPVIGNAGSGGGHNNIALSRTVFKVIRM